MEESTTCRGDQSCGWKGLESLNGKFNRAIICNHKSQKGGKTAWGQKCTWGLKSHWSLVNHLSPLPLSVLQYRTVAEATQTKDLLTWGVKRSSVFTQINKCTFSNSVTYCYNTIVIQHKVRLWKHVHLLFHTLRSLSRLFFQKRKPTCSENRSFIYV